MLKPGRVSLKKQTVWNLLPILSITAVNLISVPLFYRYLGAERYALWFYVLTLSGSFGFMDLGLGVAVGRYIGVAIGRGDRMAVEEYWGTANALAIPIVACAALLFVGLGVVFGPRWFNVPAKDVALLRWSFAAGGLGLFLSYYGQFWNILSQAHLDYPFIGLLRGSLSLVQILIALCLALWTRNPFILIVWAALVAAFQLLLYVLHARSEYGLGFQLRYRSWARTREMSAFTARTFVALLAGSLFGSIDRLILGKLAAPADFAHYTIAANVGARVQGLSTAVMGPVFCNTNIALDRPRGPADIYNETFSFTFGWFLHLTLWSIVWHPLFLSVWLGPQVGRAVGVVFPILISAFCLNAIANISAAQFGPLNRVGTHAIFQTATGILTAAGAYVGWNVLGLTGVAYAYLFGRIGDVAQDLYVIRLIGAGGWLAGSTWRMVALQVFVAGSFFLLSRLVGSNFWVAVSLALFHGSVIAAYLGFRERMR